MRALDLEGLRGAIVDGGLRGLPLAEQFDGFCDRLHSAGFPLGRANLSISTLHPRYGAHSFIWRATTTDVVHIPRERSSDQVEMFRRSPIHYMRRNGLELLRRRLDPPTEPDFPVFAELREEGMVDYAARIIGFGLRADRAAGGGDPAHVLGRGRLDSLEGLFFSCATGHPDGFDEERLQQVIELLPYLALAVESRATLDVATTLLRTYVGEDAGRRVLTGEIDRGSVQVIPAVIWLCDLRGFTRATDRLPRESLTDLLDSYLEFLARPVEENGGQILKFLGDGFLATFNLATLDGEGVCAKALGAAEELLAAFPRFNDERRTAGLPALDVGLVLHQGEVLYGNIGTLDRLDFTVIGPAINEASRIEALCRPLQRRLLVSSTFYQAAGSCRSRLISLGVHALRGVREPQELFTLEAGTSGAGSGFGDQGSGGGDQRSGVDDRE